MTQNSQSQKKILAHWPSVNYQPPAATNCHQLPPAAISSDELPMILGIRGDPRMGCPSRRTCVAGQEHKHCQHMESKPEIRLGQIHGLKWQVGCSNMLTIHLHSFFASACLQFQGALCPVRHRVCDCIRTILSSRTSAGTYACISKHFCISNHTWACEFHPQY